jgi:predicted phage tail protein
MRRLFLTAALFCLLPMTALAQTNPVAAGQAFTVAFDHDGQNVTGFQCNVDGKPAGAVLATTARTCAIPGQSSGAHAVTVTAINAFGSATSPALTVTAGTAPTAPSNLRISMTVAINADGTAELLAFNVSKEP